MNPGLSPPPAAEDGQVAEITVRNAQRLRPLDAGRIRDFAAELVEELGIAAELGLRFVSAREMARANMRFLGHAGPTDVITFDHGSTPGRLRGDCLVCVAVALEQADVFGTRWTEEIARYVIHGVLHLCGHDDLEPAARRRMKRAENRLVRWAAARFDLAAFGRRARRAP